MKNLFDDCIWESFSTRTPMGNLSMKDIVDAYNKIKESLPSDIAPGMKDVIVHPHEAELLLPHAINIERDKYGKVVSFRWAGKNMRVIKSCPEGRAFFFNLEPLTWGK